MKNAKWVALLLVLALCVGMLAGCGGGSGVEQADVGAFVPTDEKLEISWLSYYTLGGCGEGTPSELLIEDTFNIEMKPIFTESGKYNDKKKFQRWIHQFSRQSLQNSPYFDHYRRGFTTLGIKNSKGSYRKVLPFAFFVGRALHLPHSDNKLCARSKKTPYPSSLKRIIWEANSEICPRLP